MKLRKIGEGMMMIVDGEEYAFGRCKGAARDLKPEDQEMGVSS